MKYQVIVFVDDTNDRQYYQSYIEGDDTMLGNLECAELPPYQDINKAHACYWDGTTWRFDHSKHLRILAEIEQAEAEAKAEEERRASIPTNEELNEMVLTSMQAVAEAMAIIESTMLPLKALAELMKGGNNE